ncbi:hypothetical protein G5I_11749, partial [Acromyrmex echinatior]
VSHPNANYESPDAIWLSLQESRLQRQLFVASLCGVHATVSASVISIRIQLEASSTHHQERQNRPEKAQRDWDAQLRHTRLAWANEFHRALNFSGSKDPMSILYRENSGLTSFSRRKSKFHRSRRSLRRITSPFYARRAWKQTELHFGHIGENPFDNGSWGKEHFQPSTVPWQLNPRSHGRPSVSVFILFYLI